VGGSGQCGCVISVAMYSSVSPEAITRGQGREQEVWRRWVASETMSDFWRVVRSLGWWWIHWCSHPGYMCRVLIRAGAQWRCWRYQRWLGCVRGGS
jgi:hypothetical protein